MTPVLLFGVEPAFFLLHHMPDPTDSLDDGTGLAALMQRLYRLILEAAFADASLLGIPVEWDLENPFVQDVLDALADEVRGVAETTKDEIRALIGRQAAEGWTLDELAEQLEQSGVTRSAARAAIIARTETTRAYSLGSITAFQVSGVVDRLEWLTAQDEKTCPECAALDGQVTVMGQSFDGGVMFPPAHPNCRCAILPVLKED